MGGWGLVVELVAGQSGCNHLRRERGGEGEPAADARSELSLEKCFTREEEEHAGNELKCCNDCDLYQRQSPCPLPCKSRTYWSDFKMHVWGLSCFLGSPAGA